MSVTSSTHQLIKLLKSTKKLRVYTSVIKKITQIPANWINFHRLSALFLWTVSKKNSFLWMQLPFHLDSCNMKNYFLVVKKEKQTTSQWIRTVHGQNNPTSLIYSSLKIYLSIRCHVAWYRGKLLFNYQCTRRHFSEHTYTFSSAEHWEPEISRSSSFLIVCLLFNFIN